MIEPRFFLRPEPIDLDRLAALCGAAVSNPSGKDVRISGVAAIERAGPGDIAAFEAADDARLLPASRAGAILLPKAHLDAMPARCAALVVDEPSRAFAIVAAALFPAVAREQPLFGSGVASSAVVHPEARLEPDVTVEPGAVIGPRVEIGRGAVIGPNAVVGADVRIGRGASVGAGASLFCALIGDRVTIGQGARIGQGGLTLAMGRPGVDFPQMGRVILQDDVQIGANAAVDRGVERDTVIGEWSKIDALVHIGHNVAVGRCCVIFAQTSVSAGAVLEDFVVLGGHVGVSGRVRIGSGRQVAAFGALSGNATKPSKLRTSASRARRPTRRSATEDDV